MRRVKESYAMSSSKQGPINPDQVYTPESAAKELGVTARWLKDRLIKTGDMPVARCGRLIAFSGLALRQWVERNEDYWSDDDDLE